MSQFAWAIMLIVVTGVLLALGIPLINGLYPGSDALPSGWYPFGDEMIT